MIMYLITSPSGKQYCGITRVSLADRWCRHVGDSYRRSPETLRRMTKAARVREMRKRIKKRIQEKLSAAELRFQQRRDR